MNTEAPEIDPGSEQYSYGWRLGDPPVAVGPARILELVPDRLLVHDWCWPDEPSSRVRWELSPSDAGTLVRLVHEESRDLTHVIGWSDALVGIGRLVA
ncbi:MAG: SRPBCC domain-containing protein [Proteobacteria bacterium]|nr:SRPBCC domain-containing protein [Pseudomonadota bacterium]